MRVTPFAADNLPRLGFAVPAYRRPALLDRTLASQVAEAAPLGLPIHVTDDAVDDTNVAVVARWQAIYPGITHEINATRLGIDRNIDRAIRHCPARFVHVVGDDDILYPGFAARVLAAIGAVPGVEPGHVACAYRYLANDYRPIPGPPVLATVPAPGTLRALLPDHGWALGFIGANVFNRRRYMAGRADGFGSYFHHLLRLVTTVGADEPLGVVATPMVGNRADDETTATWSGDRLTVVFGLERTLAQAMRLAGTYTDAEVARTVASARRHLRYAETVRLLYWAALAERDGRGDAYWASLAAQVPPWRAAWLRAVPGPVKETLLRVIPGVRRARRALRRLP